MHVVVALLWGVFCPIAGAMAYLITFEESRRHFPDRRRARREAFLAALVAVGVFAILGGLAAVAMPWLAR
jgi:hypothetical protein